MGQWKVIPGMRQILVCLQGMTFRITWVIIAQGLFKCLGRALEDILRHEVIRRYCCHNKEQQHDLQSLRDNSPE